MTRIDRDDHLASLMSQINAIMEEQNISQAELARRMDAHPSAVGKVLNLRVDPRASTLIAMLKALNRSLVLAPVKHM